MGRQKPNKPRRVRGEAGESVSERVARSLRYAEENGLFNEDGEWWQDGQLVMLHPDFVATPEIMVANEIPSQGRSLPVTTHEPAVAPPGWPGTVVRSELTGSDEDECVRVTVHGVVHLLHASTARALSDSLLKTLDEYNEGVRKALEDPHLRAVHQVALDMMWVPGTPKPTLDDLIV